MAKKTLTLNDHLTKISRDFWADKTPDERRVWADRMNKGRAKKRAEETKLLAKARKAGL